MLFLLLLLPYLIGPAVGAPRQRILSHRKQRNCQVGCHFHLVNCCERHDDSYADSFLNDEYIESYTPPIYHEVYPETHSPGTCHRKEVSSNACTITGPSSIEVLDSHNPHDHVAGQRFAVECEGEEQKMKSVMTFEPTTDEGTCTLAIEIPAMSQGQYAYGFTSMEVWAVDRNEPPTWDKQPKKGPTVGKVTFPTWMVEQGWVQRFHPLDCKSKMSYIVVLSSPQGDGHVEFWNQLMGKQGSPPIGWRMLQGGC